MGQEIFYCAICGSQIRSADVEAGQAFELENKRFCVNCGPEMIRTLPKARVKDIFNYIATPLSGTRTPTPKPTPLPEPAVGERKSGSARRTVEARRSKTRVIAVGAGGAVIFFLVLWIMSGKKPSREESARPPAPGPVARGQERASPSPAPAPVNSVPGTTPPTLNKEHAAEQALQKARAWAQANPSDFDGAISKLQDAVFLSTGTSKLAEASRDLDLYRQKQREFFAAELQSLEPEVRAACAEERFMKAIEILGIAKGRYPSVGWQLLIGKRSREINDDAFKLLDSVKREALEARSRGDDQKVTELRSRVASWGVAPLIKEFREAVDQ